MASNDEILAASARQGTLLKDDIFGNTRQQYKLFNRDELYNSKNSIFNSIYRYGYFNPYGSVLGAKEYVFFTKPDLAIFARDDNTGSIITETGGKPKLNDGLYNEFFTNLANYKPQIVACLQSSYHQTSVSSPFNYLLQNTMVGNLSIPSLSAPTIDTATNMYGVSISYRGSSEGSDDNPDFSLEFKDDKYLNVYSFFKAYEEYETLKHHGTVKPWLKYIYNKIIHDQFCIYKFIVDEDLQTIIYWGKYYGVMPLSLPRDSFSTDDFGSGISYSVDFKAGFYDDMKPRILKEFNNLVRPYIASRRGSVRRLSMFADSTGKSNAYFEDRLYNRSVDGVDATGKEIYDYKLGSTMYVIDDKNAVCKGINNQKLATANDNDLIYDTGTNPIINPKPAIVALVSEHTAKDDVRVQNTPDNHIYRLNWFGEI